MNGKRELDTLRRDDPTGNLSAAIAGVRIALAKVARSGSWEIDGAVPFPEELLPLLQEASKLLARADAIARSHAKAHVWPAADAIRRGPPAPDLSLVPRALPGRPLP